MSRRLPVFLLLDTSGSMRGEPIESVKVGLTSMLSSLRRDPSALESVFLSIITFDREVKELIQLTPLDAFQLPDLTTPDSGPTHLGEALEVLHGAILNDVIRSTPTQKGDWKPLLFVLTDGKPSDLARYKEWTPKVQALNLGTIVGCAAGIKADKGALECLCDHVVSLDTMDSSSFEQFFKWVSASVSAGSSSMGVTTGVKLPPPPPEVNTLI
ncbi:VWA domain-containing protein [bacterium]|nr:VWA domain-containing protein [bacterium]MDA7929635.1 VWA domain-containing protein [Akkermansiaceae bacterium]MDA7934238.1 VWA domain-containing protein [Akkermansiaceae bacterium]